MFTNTTGAINPAETQNPPPALSCWTPHPVLYFRLPTRCYSCLLYFLRLTYTNSYNNVYTSHHLIGVFFSDPLHSYIHTRPLRTTQSTSPSSGSLYIRYSKPPNLSPHVHISSASPRFTLLTRVHRTTASIPAGCPWPRLPAQSNSPPGQYPSNRPTHVFAPFRFPPLFSRDAGDNLSLSLADASERKWRESGLAGYRAAGAAVSLLKYL